jgi:two-component system sensor histidine kinase KdpD
VLLVFLALVVTTAAVGGRLPAVIGAIVGFLCANWYFTPPFYRWSIAEGENVVALAVFLGVALVVSRFVDAAARRTAEAARARSEARTLASLAATMSEDDPLPSRFRPGPSRPTSSKTSLPASSWCCEARASAARTGPCSTPSRPSSPPSWNAAASESKPDGPTPWPRPTNYEAPCSKPCPTTCEHRWRPSRRQPRA